MAKEVGVIVTIRIIKRLRNWNNRSQVREFIDKNYRQTFNELDRSKQNFRYLMLSSKKLPIFIENH
jgi:sulfur transfer protein SufE